MRTACLILKLSIILLVIASLSSLSEPGSSTDGGQAAPLGCDETDSTILDWAGWNMDMDGNRMDDRLGSGLVADPISGGRIGINVHLDHPPTEGDVDSILTLAVGAGLEPEFIRAGRYITAVYLTVNNMPPSSFDLLARMAGVTMVEYRPGNMLFNDVSAKAVRSGPSADYSPYTAGDLGYSGSGVTVAVIDTGADDAAHESLRGKFVYGVDFTGVTIIYGLNPDDIDGHGTHVAGTVMGTGGSSGTYRGVGPGADLVDIRFARVFGDVTGNGDQAIEWLIENHGVDPDIVVDNPPHATFNGEDAQLQAAIDHLLQLIAQDPVDVPAPPAFPDKSFDNGK